MLMIKALREAMHRRKKSKQKIEQFKCIGTNVQIEDMSGIHYKEMCILGNNIYIGGGCYIWAIGGLEIGDNSILGPRVTIHTSNHRYEDANYLPYDNRTIYRKVKIGRNVWIGDSAMLCPGCEIGDGVVVAMGAVVSGKIPKGAVVGGNPAKIIKMRNMDLYEELDKNKRYYFKAKQEHTLEPINGGQTCK